MKPHKATITSLVALASCIACSASVNAQVAASTNPLLDCSKWDPDYTPTKTEGLSGNDTIGYEPVAVDDSEVTGGTTGGTAGGSTSTPTPAPTATSSGTPTSTPTPTPTATKSPVITTNTPYYTSGGTSSMRVTSDVHDGVTVRYYRAGSVSSKYKQNLSAVKSYPTPSGSGVLRTVGGQKILAKSSSTNLSGLDANIINIIDEVNLTAAALGLPDPVITAGHDTAGHSSGSLHYSGDAIDLRCNGGYASASACKQWVVTLANALGTGYDVIFEDYGGANSHVHIGWKG